MLVCEFSFFACSKNKKKHFFSLRPRHRIIAAGGMPPVQFDSERERASRRERFGKYGLKSGVPVEELFPTAEEIEEEEAIGLFREFNNAKKEYKELQKKKRESELARYTLIVISKLATF